MPPAAPVETWIVDLAAGRRAITEVGAGLGMAASPPAAGSTSLADREMRSAAYQALRLLIARCDGGDRAHQPFVVMGTGKPTLSGEGCDFSLAHSGSLALIALSTIGPVGVDLLMADRAMAISAARRHVLEAAGVAVAAGAALPRPDTDAAVRQAWVRLEAVAKADGSGIGALLERLEARPGHGGAFAVAGLPVAIDVDVDRGFQAAIAVARVKIDRRMTSVARLPIESKQLGALIAAGRG